MGIIYYLTHKLNYVKHFLDKIWDVYREYNALELLSIAHQKKTSMAQDHQLKTNKFSYF